MGFHSADSQLRARIWDLRLSQVVHSITQLSLVQTQSHDPILASMRMQRDMDWECWDKILIFCPWIKLEKWSLKSFQHSSDNHGGWVCSENRSSFQQQSQEIERERLRHGIYPLDKAMSEVWFWIIKLNESTIFSFLLKPSWVRFSNTCYQNNPKIPIKEQWGHHLPWTGSLHLIQCSRKPSPLSAVVLSCQCLLFEHIANESSRFPVQQFPSCFSLRHPLRVYVKPFYEFCIY